MKTLCCYFSILLFSLGVLFCSSSFANGKKLPAPKIKCGMAKISGQFIRFNEYKAQNSNLNNIQILCRVINPLTGGYEEKRIEIKDDESFSLEMPIEVSHAVGIVSIENLASYVVSLVDGEETKFDFDLENRNLCIKWVSGPNFIFGDSETWSDVFVQADESFLYDDKHECYNLDTIKHFIANPQEYVSFMLKNELAPKINLISTSPKVPEIISNLYAYDFRIMCLPQIIHYNYGVWDMYKMYMRRLHKEQGTTDKVEFTESDSIAYCPPMPDISYWTFLKKFELNDPCYLYSGMFIHVGKMLLKNKAFSTPPIEEMPIDKWLKRVKVTLADLIGFSDDPFYDVLVCNAYSQQFIDKRKPLSTQQIKNIKSFYKGGEVEKVLLRENEKISKPKEVTPSEVKLNVSKEKGKQIMSSIVSKYKGKVVVVDFWATWCAPCMRAMADIDKIKPVLIDKGVVFVYITTESSPKKKYEELSAKIKGEHYYLTTEEWGNVMTMFSFRGIPAYAIYGKNSQVIETVTGYPGNDNMEKMISNALAE